MAESAIVLGGTAGIGRAVVDALLERGHRVGVVARGRERLDEMKAALGDRIAVQAADVAKADALDNACDALVAEIGAPDIWVNCAMATSFSPFDKVGAAEFERILDVTLLGQVNGTRAAMRLMSAGRIVCVGSGLGYRSVPNQAAYCAAKHGLNGFAASLRSEFLRANSPLSIHLVQLPAVNTPQFDWALNRMDAKPQPAPPIFAPELAARAVMQAIDGGAREILVGRSVLQLVFGTFVLPDYLDRKLARMGVDAQKSDAPDNFDAANLYDPVPYPARAAGSYGDRASDTGVIVDGDVARKLVFGGALAAVFVLGLLLG